MMYIGTALLAGLAVWVALGMYYAGRGRLHSFDVRAGWTEYVSYLKTGKGKWFFLAGICVMACCLFGSLSHGLSWMECVRDGLTAAWLVPVALIDAKEQIIPHSLTGSGFGAWLVWAVLRAGIGGVPVLSVLTFSLGGCAMGGGMFLVCRLITGDGVGMGDVRVFGILGLLYGIGDTFSIVFFTILSMTVYGAAAVLCKRKNLKSRVPMGPFILMSYILCRLLGI